MNISSKNTPLNTVIQDSDFTEEYYLTLLRKWLLRYDFIKFSELGQTVISDGAYMNNASHIAHNVVVKKYSVINSNVTIFWSVRIYANSWIGPSGTYRDKTSMPPQTNIGAGTTVTEPTHVPETCAVNPERLLKKIHKRTYFLENKKSENI